jgi:hypothetical protein
MKKILFFGLTTLLCSNISLKAQQKSTVDLKREVPASTIHKGTHVPRTALNVAQDKKTRGGARWYSSADAAGIANGSNLFDQAHLNVNYMWQDSTLKGNFGGTSDNIWIKSVGQVLDPTAAVHNDLTAHAGLIQIGKNSVFNIDSVAITCAYVRNPAKASIVDTLIVTISKGNSAPSDLLFWPEDQAAVVGPYSVDTIFVANPAFDYTTNTLKKNVGSVAYTVKIPLTVAVANDTTANGWNQFLIPVTGLQNLPGGSIPTMTMNFKSGDTWVPNVDSAFNNGLGLNYMLFASSRENPPAGFRAYTKRDYNMSSVMKNDTTGWGFVGYIPSFYYNSPGYEHHWFDWKLSCASCAPVAVNDVTIFNEVNVFPNPASTELAINLTLKENAKNVSFDITNTLGQVVKSIKLGNVNANQTTGEIIKISDLSAGMYIYTLHANGQKVSNKLLVK